MSDHIRTWVAVVFGDSLTRFAGVPIDVRRWILAPMILYPYVIAASDGVSYMVRRGERCYIDGLYVGNDMTTFTRTRSEWVTGSNGQFQLCGVHGPYHSFRFDGMLLSQKRQMVARREGSKLIIGMPANDVVWHHYDTIREVSYFVSAPEQYTRVVVVDIRFSVLEGYILWDGARGICSCVPIEGRYVATESVLPWVPVSISATKSFSYNATAPWGEIW